MQVDAIAKENKKNKKLKSKESFLSGFLPNDKILPVMTLVINFSGAPWTAPTSLKQMFPKTDGRFLEMVNDYKIHIIDPSNIESETFDNFKTELCPVMLFLKYSRDKNELLRIVQQDKRLNHIPNDIITLLNIITNSKLSINETKGETDMCEAIKEIVEDSKLEGKLETLIEFIQDGLITIEQAAQRLNTTVEKFKLRSKKLGHVF